MIAEGDESGDGGVGDDHVLHRRPGLIHLAKVFMRARHRVQAVPAFALLLAGLLGRI
jgi:hypothetical protein